MTVSIDSTQNSESGLLGHTDNTHVRPRFQGEAWPHERPKSLRQCADFSWLPQVKKVPCRKGCGGDFGNEIMKDFMIAVTGLNMNNKLSYLFDTCLYSKFKPVAITRLSWTDV